MTCDHEFTDQSLYVIYEYRERGPDGIVLVFEDDADTLRSAIDYATQLERSDSGLFSGEFHAASPGEQYLEDGDWFLAKKHGVGVSHGLPSGGSA